MVDTTQTNDLPPSCPKREVRIFLGFAPADECFAKELDDHLAPLRRQHLIRIWHSHKTEPGVLWQEETKEQLEAAELILFLISSAFLASDQNYEVEMKYALNWQKKNGHVKIIPILIRPCNLDGVPFLNLQIFPRNAKPVSESPNPDATWTQISDVIGEAARALLRDRPPASVSSSMCSSDPVLDCSTKDSNVPQPIWAAILIFFVALLTITLIGITRDTSLDLLQEQPLLSLADGIPTAHDSSNHRTDFLQDLNSAPQAPSGETSTTFALEQSTKDIFLRQLGEDCPSVLRQNDKEDWWELIQRSASNDVSHLPAGQTDKVGRYYLCRLAGHCKEWLMRQEKHVWWNSINLRARRKMGPQGLISSDGTKNTYIQKLQSHCKFRLAEKGRGDLLSDIEHEVLKAGNANKSVPDGIAISCEERLKREGLEGIKLWDEIELSARLDVTSDVALGIPEKGNDQLCHP